MQLYLCEKPTQGQDIAQFLGMTSLHKKKGYFQKGDQVVTWALGHLFGLQPPEYYEQRLQKKWQWDALPVIPQDYQYILSVKSKSQFRTIKTLLKKAKRVFITTDPDPEGECIARNILRFAGYRGHVSRILFGATDKRTLTKAFSKPLPERETRWMYEVAQARSQADWVVGMNLTMALTLLIQRLEAQGGYPKAFPVGRVKTPAAMLVLLREQAIQSFQPTPYYTVAIEAKSDNDEVVTFEWMIPDNMCQDGKLMHRSIAEKVMAYCQTLPHLTVTNVNRKKEAQSPPLPFDLTQLQLACEPLGFSPDDTLSIAQSLYDKPLSATTYPRTDTSELPIGLTDDISSTLSHLTSLEVFSEVVEQLDPHRRTAAWSDAKVKVHHGIIPTTQPPNWDRMVERQKSVYTLIARRYLMQFLPDALVEHTAIEVSAGNLMMNVSGKSVTQLGWRQVAVRETSEHQLPKVKVGDVLKVISVDVIERFTRRPKRFSQASLAQAMTNIADHIDDPELKKTLSNADGIGTVATRPTIIRDLLKSGLLQEEKRQLKPSRWLEKHWHHIPKSLKQPANSAIWERGFSAIRDGKLTQEKFLSLQEQFVSSSVIELKRRFAEVH